MKMKYSMSGFVKGIRCAGLAIILCTGSVAAQESSQTSEPKQEQKEETQFNGLDYMLQKPAKNERFARKKFGDHLFVSGEAGLIMDRSAGSLFATPGLGLRSGLLVGDWFTPVHGIRLGLNAGLHNGLGGSNPYFVGFSADYLMNLTSLLHKDNPARMFELIGVAGGEYQLLYRQGNWTHAGGFRLGMQTRFNFSPLTFFYLEPRVGIYTDGIDGIKTWMRYDWEASLMAGFGYRLLSAPTRRHEPFWGAGQGLFISAAGGMASTLTSASNPLLDPGATVMISIGDQFTPVSSLRLSGLVRYLKTGQAYDKSSFGAQLDYLFNMHSLFGGYDPGRLFEMSGVVGAGYHSVAVDDHLNTRWSVGAGLHGEFRLNGHWGLFLEPRVDVFTNGAWADVLSAVDPIPSLLAGFTYRPVAPSFDRSSVIEDEFDLPKGIGDLYLTLGGGFAGVMKSSFSEPIPNKGYRLFGGLGTWWNPVSGARLLLNGSSINAPYSTHHTWAVGGQLDYLLNFSNLFMGYDRERLFSLSGVAGLNYDYVSSEGYFQHTLGAGVGLQGSFRINDMFDVFIEPRLNVAQNNRWEHSLFSSVDMVPTITAGLSYHLYGYGRTHGTMEKAEEFRNENFIDHLFYGIGVGAAGILHHDLFSRPLDRMGPTGTFYLGKWFTAASGLRLSGAGGVYGDSEPGYRKFGLVQLDYLWNINSTLYGYNPSRIFEANVGVGAVLSYATSNHPGWYPGAGVSLQGLWNVGSGVGLFIEPQVRVFGKNYSRESYAGMPVDLLTSVNVGIQYRLNQYDYRANHAAYDESDKYFLSLAYTGRWLRGLVNGFTGGYGAALSFGKWYTPLSAWRVGVDYGYYDQDPQYMALAFSADYLFNLSAFTAGYNPNRIFDVIVLGGIYGGAGNYEKKNEFVYGARAGLQGRFNVSSDIDLFVEPQIVASHIPHSYNNFDPEARVLIGFNYKLGRGSAAVGSRAPEKRNFFSLSVGPSLFSETIMMSQYRKVSVGTDLSFGRWFTGASGVSVGLGYDFIAPHSSRTLNVGTLHADYLLNFTSLLDSDPDRRFHLIGSVGTGLGWSNYNSEGGVGWVARGGVQLRWNVSPSFDFYVEPSMTLWDDKLYDGVLNTHHFIGVGRVSLGTAYRF